MLFSLFPIDWDPRWNGFAFWVTNSRSREKAVRSLFRYEYQSFQKIRLDNSLELWTQPFLFLDRTSFVSGFCSFVCMLSDGSASGCLSHPSTFVFLLFHQASDSRYPCSLCFARWRYGSLFRILRSLLAFPNAFLFVFAFGFPFSFPYLLLTFRLPDTPLYPNSISALRLSKVDLLSRLPSHGSLEHMLLVFRPSVYSKNPLRLLCTLCAFVPFHPLKKNLSHARHFPPRIFFETLAFSDLPVEHLPIFFQSILCNDFCGF